MTHLGQSFHAPLAMGTDGKVSRFRHPIYNGRFLDPSTPQSFPTIGANMLTRVFFSEVQHPMKTFILANGVFVLVIIMFLECNSYLWFLYIHWSKYYSCCIGSGICNYASLSDSLHQIRIINFRIQEFSGHCLHYKSQERLVLTVWSGDELCHWSTLLELCNLFLPLRDIFSIKTFCCIARKRDSELVTLEICLPLITRFVMACSEIVCFIDLTQ